MVAYDYTCGAKISPSYAKYEGLFFGDLKKPPRSSKARGLVNICLFYLIEFIIIIEILNRIICLLYFNSLIMNHLKIIVLNFQHSFLKKIIAISSS